MKKRILAMLLALTMMVSCLPVVTLADTPEAHIHCDCGKQTTLDAVCASCGTKAVTWTATDAMPTAQGHYYLTTGISAQGLDYKDGVKIAICLHGQNITSTSGGQIAAVGGGAELVLTDCAPQQGKLTGATSYAYGSALRVKKGGTMILYGGKITGNSAPTSGDGTIYVDKGDATTDGGKFYMYGGEISDNSARRGAGIFTVNPGTSKPGQVYILGGKITGNEAKGSGSTKGGGGILAFTPIVVGGNAIISGNTAKEGPADIYLRNSGTFAGQLQLSAEKPLTGGAKIAVGSDTEATDDPNNITAITGTPTDWSCDWLTYAGQSVSYVGGKFVAGHYHGDKLYTPISSNTELANATGYGYLTTDLNLGGPQTRKTDLNLCLNGHTVTAKKDKRIFTSAKDAGFTFSIEDCTAYTDAAGVYHAGKLTGGSDTGVNGGGAMYLAAGNTLHIYDGILTGNTATSHGGALTVLGTLYLHGGQITGNSTGGVYAASGAKVYVDGDPYVFGNTGSNLYLCGNDLLNVGTLEKTAKIGIRVEAGDRTVSTACPDYRSNILSDDPDYTMQYRDSALYLAAPITHVHCICGSATCTEHESVGFTEWTEDDSLPGSGNYCLTKDVTLTKAVAVSGQLNLCLNGHTITQTGADRVFKLDAGPLSITDCGQGGKLVGGTNDYGAAIVVMEGTTFNLYGGTITGSQPAKPDKAGTGAAIFLRSSNAAGATVNMYGGEITGNGNDLTWGGAITNGSGNENNEVYVNIYGGKIHGNTAGTGGAIRLENKAVLTIAGGQITGNKATTYGGAVYLAKNAQLKLRGGTISGNTASLGGGIYPASGTVTVSGAPVVTDNLADGKQDNLYLLGDQIITLEAMTQGADVGVTAAKIGRAISTQWNEDYSGYFHSDNNKGEIVYRDKTLYMDIFSDHLHCLCDGTASGCDHTKQKWIPWDSTDSLPAGDGYYYLTGDVQLTKAVAVSGQLNLCLNGHTVTQTGADRVFKLDAGTLSITDCTQTGVISGGTNDYGAAIVVMEGTTFNLFGGKITGSQPAKPDKAGTGAAIFLRSSNAAGATVNMYGGEITGNGNDLTWGGAITNGSGNENNEVYVNIYGGKIHGNTAGTGGAIRLENKAVLTIAGGEITGNKATTHGGAVYLAKNAQLKLQGGTISGNTASLGGGIYPASGTVTVSGAPVVTDNLAGGKQSNLYLLGDQIITLEAMTDGAKVGISAAKGGRAISTQQDTDYARYFVSDSSYFSVIYKDKALYLDLSSEHQHCVCTGNVSVCDHEKQKWMAWDNTGSLPTVSGYYYLVSDVQLTATVKAEADQQIFLCLNGKTVKAAENAGHYILAKGTTLSVTDCSQEPGRLTGGNKAYGGSVNVVAGATMNLFAGKLSGNTAPNAEGGAIYLQAGAKKDTGLVAGGVFNMYGGEISGNTAGVGGAIRAAGLTDGETPSQVNIYGGKICDNKAVCKVSGEDKSQGTGGAIAAIYGSQVNIYGGQITGNSAEDNGGAIYLNNKATLHLKDGKIEKNTAAGHGGAIFATAPETVLTMDGGEITGNEAQAGGAVMLQTRSFFTMNGGKVTGNKSVKSGGGAFYVSTNTDLVVNGGEISGNHTEASGGAIYALRSRVQLNGGTVSDNAALNRGGAFVTSGAELTIGKCTISGNSAKEGGAGYINRSSAKKADGTYDNYPSAVTVNEGAVITGNKGQTNCGGLIVANDGVTLTMNGGEISKNTAASGGAIMTWTGATFTMKGGKITGNSSTGSGGALYISTDSTFKMEGGEITGNTAKGNGGAAYALASRFIMTGGKITGNTATSAGAVFLLRAEAEFAGGSVSGNRAKSITTVSGGTEKTTGGTAGAVYISGATANMRGTSFTGNSADVNGGAIVMGRSSYTKNGVKQTKDASMHISAGLISGNTAGKVGGAMLLQSAGTVVKMTGGTITGNTSQNSGGGIYASTNTTFTMTGGAIVKNHSEAAGGGMYVLRAKVTITGGELNSNTAATSGAQMVVGGDTADVYLKDMKLHSGQAKIAGGVVVQSDGKFTAENCEFYNHTTTTNSGAVYVSARTGGNFINCKFYNNTTATSGGALSAMNFSQVNITGCSFENNRAETMGGAIYASQASVTTIEDTTIRNCTAGTRGGAITCRGSMFLRNSLVEGCSAKEEGGAIYTDTNTAGGSGAQRGLVVEGTKIQNNTSGGVGGGFYVYKGCRLEVYDSQITGNTAPAEGGAIWAYEDLELHNTKITGNASGGEGYAVFMHPANYDGHSYFSSLNKLSGSVIIKDNQGGDLWMGSDVVFAIVGTGLGEDTHMQVTLDSGILTSRILGAYHYEGGDQVYTVTYGDRSMTDPEMLPVEQEQPATEESETATTEAPAQEAGSDDTMLYVGIGGIAAVILAAAVALVLVKKKKTSKAETKE